MARTHTLVQAVDKAERVLKAVGPFVRKLMVNNPNGHSFERELRVKLIGLEATSELISLEWSDSDVKIVFTVGQHTFILTVTDIRLELSMVTTRRPNSERSNA